MLIKSLDKQLAKLIRDKKIEIKYPKGYQKWRKNFNSTLRETKGDVNKALDKIHGKSNRSKKINT